MTPNQMRTLQRGDLVRHKMKHSAVYVVTDTFIDRVTAARTVDITNPGEWDIVLPAPGDSDPDH